MGAARSNKSSGCSGGARTRGIVSFLPVPRAVLTVMALLSCVSVALLTTASIAGAHAARTPILCSRSGTAHKKQNPNVLFAGGKIKPIPSFLRTGGPSSVLLGLHHHNSLFGMRGGSAINCKHPGFAATSAATSTFLAAEPPRGGGKEQQTQTQNTTPPTNTTIQQQKLRSVKVASGIVALLATVFAGYAYRQVLWSIWQTQGAKLSTALLTKLQQINALGWRGNALYMVSLMAWEACGLPTTIVETSAGMAFSLRQALWMNPVAKNTGAFASILLIRYCFSNKARQMLQDDPSKASLLDLLSLVNESAKIHPLRVATLLRFSPFPELFKHTLLALMGESLSPVTILLAIAFHGTPFSLLWALAGNEASQQLLHPDTFVPSRIVQLGVLSGAILGLTIVPVLFGLWVNQLRLQRALKESSHDSDNPAISQTKRKNAATGGRFK
jgi:hypothetical protein